MILKNVGCMAFSKGITSIALFILLSGRLLLVAETDSVDFAHEIVPVLQRHCVECHGGEEAEGGFSINNRRLFLEGEAAVPGNADESLFIELIQDPDPEYRMPSDEKPPVPEAEVALLMRWVDEGLPWEPGFTFGEPTYEPPLKPRLPELPPVVKGRSNPVDRFIDAYLAEGGYAVPQPLDDSAFLRRVSMDLVGLLPTVEETRSFLSDKSPDKRQRAIDSLLARDIDYTEHWLTFWNDLLRNDYDGTGFITGGRSQISGWLYGSLKGNKPYDLMISELIAPPNEESSGFIDGIKWRGVVSAGQSLPIQFAQSVSQSFLGINLKCASCHDSFIDQWTLADSYNLAAVYSEEPLELTRCDKPTGVMAKAAWLFPEIGQVDPSVPKTERLAQLADLFTHPQNGRVTRTIVNRLWAQLMGRGIVHPLDAKGTEPWNADLLDWLAYDFQENGYDIKRTLRLIANSHAYQSQASSLDEGDSADYVYRGPVSKRLTAEQFVDAVWGVGNAAPAAMDAPIARDKVSDSLAEELSVPSTWIWGASLDHGLPPHGERVIAYRTFSPAKPLSSATLVAAADLEYEVIFNGERIFSGRGWKDLKAAVITSRMNPEENRLLIGAENAGSRPNAAGIFCAIRLEYSDGSHEVIQTDEQWLTRSIPPDTADLTEYDLDSGNWDRARIAKDTGWEKGTNERAGTILAKAYVGRDKPVRAALVKNNSLMRALGRPNRDQIVTSRPNELTTLEAVDLSTSFPLIDHLRSGADRLLERHEKDPTTLIDDIYLTLMTRFPSKSEQRLLRGALGRNPDTEAVTDLLWALAMTPEFFILR